MTAGRGDAGTAQRLLRRRWDEARAALDSSDYEAFADLGSEANRRLMLVLCGSLASIGGVIGAIALLPYADRLGLPAASVLSVSATVVLLGVGALLAPSRTPLVLLDVIVAGGVVVISIAIAQGRGVVAGYTVLFYLWPAVVIALLRSDRAVIGHDVFIVLCAGVVFAFDDSFSSPLFWWGLVVLGLAVVWHTTGWLVRRTRQLARRERRARARAEQASSALAVVSQRKSHFLASMSHELRTPLNAVIGFAEVLQRGLPGDLNERQREYVDDIVGSGHHLLALIDDTLDEVSIESGHLGVEATTVDVAGLFEDAVRMVRERADRGGIDLHVRAEPATAQLDGRKVKQVLVNLLANAVKFTPEGGRVTVVAEQVGPWLECSVSDTGPGIDPAQHETIFGAFHQAEGATSAEGTGLGLSVARRFVDVHGGRIWVESEPGAGACFRFTIPTHPSLRERTLHDPGAARQRAERSGEAEEVLSDHALLDRARAFSAITGIGTLLGALIVDTPGASITYLWLATAWSLGVATVISFVRGPLEFDDRFVLRIAHALNGGATLITVAGVVYLGPLAPAAIAVLAIEAFFYHFIDLRFGTRSSWYMTAFSGIALAVGLGIASGNDAPLAQWLAGFGTVTVCAFLVGWLMARLRVLVVAERQAALVARRAAATLAEVSRHKSQFLAGMSHELRTPLNAVIGFAEVLERELPGPLNDRQRGYVVDIVESGRHLLELINDVLDLAKIDAGRVELARQEVGVASLLEQVVARIDVSDKRLHLTVDADDDLTVHADDVRLHQVVAILLANAVKFTPAGGAVEIRGRCDGAMARIEVADSGPGIDPADHETIFEAFHQSDADPARAAEGAGLGLALAKRLVEMHGGRVGVRSARDEGATFTVVLPRVGAVPPDPVDPVDQVERPSEVEMVGDGS